MSEDARFSCASPRFARALDRTPAMRPATPSIKRSPSARRPETSVFSASSILAGVLNGVYSAEPTRFSAETGGFFVSSTPSYSRRASSFLATISGNERAATADRREKQSSLNEEKRNKNPRAKPKNSQFKLALTGLNS